MKTKVEIKYYKSIFIIHSIPYTAHDGRHHGGGGGGGNCPYMIFVFGTHLVHFFGTQKAY